MIRAKRNNGLGFITFMQAHTIQANYVDHQEGHYIAINFNRDWSQEDVAQLSRELLDKLGEIKVIEHAQGADLETLHFLYLDQEFLLSFEFYGQSCWIESLNNQGLAYLNDLYKVFCQ